MTAMTNSTVQAMDALHSSIRNYTASRLLAAYLQAGDVDMHAIDEALVLSQMVIGEYRIRGHADLVRLGFLLRKRTRIFARTVSEQMHSLRSSSQRRLTAIDGQIRGAVNWSQTIIRQITQPSRFVCSDPQRAFDLAENQMLKMVVELHTSDLERVLRRWPAQPETRSKGWRGEIHQLADDLRSIRTNPYYRRISHLVRAGRIGLSPRLVQNVRRRRARMARLILRHYLEYQATLGPAPDPLAVRRALVEGLRWPNPDKLFELFTLFRLVELLQKGHPRALIVPIHTRGRSEGWFALLREGDVTATVYYQTVPPDLRIRYDAAIADPSIRDYATTLNTYGVHLGSLRPDVVVDCRRGVSDRRLLLVEVKHSKVLSTIRQGLRELADYYHLVRTRQDGKPVFSDIRGLLSVLELPPSQFSLPVGATNGRLIITDTAGMYSSQDQDLHPDVRDLISYCWFC